MHECKKCGSIIPPTCVIDGKRKSLSSRVYCLKCSPFGAMQGYALRKGRHSVDDSKFVEAVRNSTSIRQVLHKIGLVEAGGNYAGARSRINSLGLSTDHFLGHGHLKGKSHDWSPRIPLEEILVEDSLYSSSYRLKNRLLKVGLLERKCYNCRRTKWLGEPIPLELEHKNGRNRDHRIENLTLLCPNCHTFTPTYRGRNKGRTHET